MWSFLCHLSIRLSSMCQMLIPFTNIGKFCEVLLSHILSFIRLSVSRHLVQVITAIPNANIKRNKCTGRLTHEQWPSLWGDQNCHMEGIEKLDAVHLMASKIQTENELLNFGRYIGAVTYEISNNTQTIMYAFQVIRAVTLSTVRSGTQTYLEDRRVSSVHVPWHIRTLRRTATWT